MRRGAAGVMWHALIARNLGAPLSKETARSMLGVLNGALAQLETVWLRPLPAGPFMMGAHGPCIADLLVTEELFNLVLLEAVPPDFGMA